MYYQNEDLIMSQAVTYTVQEVMSRKRYMTDIVTTCHLQWQLQWTWVSFKASELLQSFHRDFRTCKVLQTLPRFQVPCSHSPSLIVLCLCWPKVPFWKQLTTFGKKQCQRVPIIGIQCHRMCFNTNKWQVIPNKWCFNLRYLNTVTSKSNVKNVTLL